MWITLYRRAGQRKWRRARRTATPADYSSLRAAGVELAEITRVEVTSLDERTLSPTEGLRIARAILQRMTKRGRLRRACDPGRVSYFPAEAL